MLDAYIIDRIRRERELEQREGAFIPLHIEVPQPPPLQPAEEVEREPERGAIIIDFLV